MSDTGGDTETEGEVSTRSDRQDRQFNMRNHMSEQDTGGGAVSRDRSARNSVSDAMGALSVAGGGQSSGEDRSDRGGRTRTMSEGESKPGGAASKLNTEGLPSGWTMQVAPNGRVFFINHLDKKTTWVDPRTSRPSALPSQSNVPNRRDTGDLGPLPEGWEERVHTDGRMFFIDHNSRVTQWEDPRISNPNIAGQAVPYSRDYKRKYEYLKQQLKKPSNVPNKIEIKVRRISILEDSYRHIHSIPSNKVDTLKTKLWIEFDGEVMINQNKICVYHILTNVRLDSTMEELPENGSICCQRRCSILTMDSSNILLQTITRFR